MQMEKQYRNTERRKRRASFPRLFLARGKCHMPQGKGKPRTLGCHLPPECHPLWRWGCGCLDQPFHPSLLKRGPSLTPGFVLRYAGYTGGHGGKHRQGDREDHDNAQGQLPDLKEKAELVLALTEAVHQCPGCTTSEGREGQ